MRRIAVVVPVVLLAASMTTPASAGAGGADPIGRWPICGEWREVATPRGGAVGYVQDVAVISPYEAWVVTDYGADAFNESLVYRWDGIRWTEVAFPTPPRAGDPSTWSLTTIAEVGPDAVWAVGFRVADALRPISARWDGARWRLVPMGIPHLHGRLEGLTVVPGTSQLWAVGSSGHHPLALRWDGNAWHKTRTPRLEGRPTFADVVSTAGGATWAVGSTTDVGGRMMFARWTGREWTVRLGPHGGLTAIDGYAADSLWAAGSTPKANDPYWSNGVVMRREDGGWRVARRFDRVSNVNAIQAVSPTQAWAVGHASSGADQTPSPIVLRRTGARWRIDWAPAIDGWFSAIGGTPHNLWAFMTPAPSDTGSFVPYHRC